MASMNKILFKKLMIPLLRLISPLFFDKKYLRGRHFDNADIGWIWVFRSIIWQKIFGFNRSIPWPVSPFIVISKPSNIEFDVDNLDNFQQFGNYFQNFSGKIVIGKGTYIAPNVGIITINHDPMNLDVFLPPKDVIIGNNCWIGMNVVILPGVVLGENTTVGASSVVTKSFPMGHCVIVGNPARLLRKL